VDFVMGRDAADLSSRLARDAEAVCRHYLSNGRRQGQYWLVGDVRNAPGGSMFVRLKGPESGPGAAGRWTDASTAEHGDLLDVIRESCGLTAFREVLDEARRFLSLPRIERTAPVLGKTADIRPGSPEAARRLISMAQPIRGTLVETYLAHRGIAQAGNLAALRYHPRCFFQPDDGTSAQGRPAMIAAVTDLAGNITGAHRTWLAPDGAGKAPVDRPRRAMGNLLGHGVRFGAAGAVLVAGEGIETMLSVGAALPGLPIVAALSAGHLAALLLPPTLRRLYIARDVDAAGDKAFAALRTRANAAGVEVLALSPRRDDFNDDLMAQGVRTLRADLQPQLAQQDAERTGADEQVECSAYRAM
jgi:Toprim domain